MQDVVVGHTLGPSGFSRGPVSVPRYRHKFILGATGCGKSTLLKTLIEADIEAGDGVIVIDPHGSLVDDIVWRIPPARTKDVIWFDPMSRKVIGLNPLEGENKLLRLEQTLLIIKQLWGDEFWGPQTDLIFRNVGLAVMDTEQSPTLIHILLAVNKKDYLKKLSERAPNPTVRLNLATMLTWDSRKESVAMGPPQNKIDSLMYNPLTRDILGQEKGLDIGRAMNDRKILLCRFSKGVLGPQAGSFLGSVLLSKILFAALERQKTRERPFCGVHVDEFHNMSIGQSPEQILSESRKYNIAFTAADQTIAQLPEGSEASIFGNVSTLISGRLGAKDAERVTKELGPPLMSPHTLQGLRNFRWYAKTLRADGFVTEAIPFEGQNVPKREGRQSKRVVLKKSAQHWGIPRSEVEARFEVIFGGEYAGRESQRAAA